MRTERATSGAAPPGTGAHRYDGAGRSGIERRRPDVAGRWRPLVAVAVPTVLVGLHGLVYGRWIVDDAAITFSYARSIATGAGPVLQPGDATVEGWSDPTWLGLITVGKLIGAFDRGTWFGVPDYVAFPKALGLIFCAALFAAYFVVARALSERPVLVTVLAGAATAATPSFVIWVMSGLENSLSAAAAGWIAAVLTRSAVRGTVLTLQTAVPCGLLAAVAALTRPDGAIYVLAYPIAIFLIADVRRKREMSTSAAASLAAFAVPVGAYLWWRVATFGELVPNTAIAKSQGFPDASSLERPFGLIRVVGFLPAVVMVVLIVVAVRAGIPNRRGLLAVLIPLALAISAFAILRPDWMEQRRFATPIWALGSLALMVCAVELFPLYTGRRVRYLGAAVAVITGAAGGVAASAAATSFRADPTVPVCAVATYAGWDINAYASALGIAHGSVVTPDVGGSALVSNLRIIDLAGLTDRDIARRWATGDMAGLRDDIFSLSPDFIETHRIWTPEVGLLADPRLAERYVLIHQNSPIDDVWLRRDRALDARQFDAARKSSGPNLLSPTDRYQLADPGASCGPTLTGSSSA